VFPRNPSPYVQSLKGEELTPILRKCLLSDTEYRGAPSPQVWTYQSHVCPITGSPKLPVHVLSKGYQHEQDAQSHHELSSTPVHSVYFSQNECTESRQLFIVTLASHSPWARHCCVKFCTNAADIRTANFLQL